MSTSTCRMFTLYPGSRAARHSNSRSVQSGFNDYNQWNYPSELHFMYICATFCIEIFLLGKQYIEHQKVHFGAIYSHDLKHNAIMSKSKDKNHNAHIRATDSCTGLAVSGNIFL